MLYKGIPELGVGFTFDEGLPGGSVDSRFKGKKQKKHGYKVLQSPVYYYQIKVVCTLTEIKNCNSSQIIIYHHTSSKQLCPIPLSP